MKKLHKLRVTLRLTRVYNGRTTFEVRSNYDFSEQYKLIMRILKLMWLSFAKTILVDGIKIVYFLTYRNVAIRTLSRDMWPIMWQQDAATTRFYKAFSWSQCVLYYRDLGEPPQNLRPFPPVVPQVLAEASYPSQGVHVPPRLSLVALCRLVMNRSLPYLSHSQTELVFLRVPYLY